MADPGLAEFSGIAKLNAALPMLSHAAALELSWLLAGARDVIRLSCGGLQAPFLLTALQERGLSVRCWDLALVPRPRDCIGPYAAGGFLSEDLSAPGAQHIIFAARNPDLAETALETALDDAALGQSLGYPKCCVGSYLTRRKEYLHGFAPCFSAGSGPWPWWSNVALEPFGWILVSHFPCRPDCAATRRLAAQHLAAVRRADPTCADLLAENLRSVVVWHPALGVLAALAALPGQDGDLCLGRVKATDGFRALIGEGRGLRLRGGELLDETGRQLARGLGVADHRGEDSLKIAGLLEREDGHA